MSVVVVGTMATMVMSGKTMLLQRVPVGKAPEALADRARDIIRQAGYRDEPADFAEGLSYDEAFFAYVRDADKTANRWSRLDAYDPVLFSYRQSSRAVQMSMGETPEDVSARYSGDVAVVLDGEGRLRSFEAMPPQIIGSAESIRAPDWTSLLAAAGLDAARLSPAPPQWNPLYFADSRTAWTGTLPGAADVPIHVEAAAYRGQTVMFQLVGPWNTPGRVAPLALSPLAQRIGLLSLLTMLVALAGVGLFIARRNLRMGRGDRRGATRLVIVVFTLGVVQFLFTAHHTMALGELSQISTSGAISLLVAVIVVVWYFALEPIVRRRWPRVLVSWTRLVSGDWRDPLVGRDVLAGCANGVVFACLFDVILLAPTWAGAPQEGFILSQYPLIGSSAFLAGFAGSCVFGIVVSLAYFFLHVLLRTVFRVNWLSDTLWVVIVVFVSLGRYQNPQPLWLVLSVNVVISAMTFVVLTRVGWLAFFAGWFAFDMLTSYPLTFHSSAWYAPVGYSGLAVVAAMALYGFWTSLGRQPLVEIRDV